MSDANTAVAGTAVFAALALELAPGIDPGCLALAQADAGALAERVAHDLGTFVPEAADLELVAVGAHFDAVELLRPGWPLHRELVQLAARAPAGRQARAGRIVMFGSHDGGLPEPLTPSPDFLGGTFRLLPLALVGDPDLATRVGTRLEQDLIERGMAGADTALLAQERFGLRIEHARYLTLHDLAAMMALQYEHAGLAPLWPLIETALLAPDEAQWLDAPPEPLLHYADGEARIALFSPGAWHARYAPEIDAGDDRLERRFAQFQARQRQFAAVLGAHGIPVNFVHCGSDAPPDL